MSLVDGIAQLETPHHALMVALSPVHFRSAWFEFRESGSVECSLCGKSIADARDIWALRDIEAHEDRHIEALDRQKVAAADMLYHLRLEEAASTVAGFIQKVSKHYHLGSLSPMLQPMGTISKFDMPQPTWPSIIEEVWGCIPSVALPENNNQPKDHDP